MSEPVHVRVAENGRPMFCDEPGCTVDTDCVSDCGHAACRYCGIGAPDFRVDEGPGGVFTSACARCERSWKE